MPDLSNKRVLLGVTGGIAAYKSPDVVRRLRDAGAEVRVVMTDSAKAFITPLTLQAISGHPVSDALFNTDSDRAMDHIDLARWADVILVAPATADFLARMTQGRADDLLTSLCLAADVPVAVAPAMNRQMWANTATRENIATLQSRGLRVFGPESGSQACGETGDGRMMEPVDLVEALGHLFVTGTLQGMGVVITAGPTWEAIDAIRGLTNRSSGRMGYALAEAAADAGARVTLISGPVNLPAPDRVQVVNVRSAEEMLQACLQAIPDTQIFIGAAAVADYRPVQAAKGKIKKSDTRITLELIQNPDIVATVAKVTPRPFVVGFAAESEDLETYAAAKLKEKQLDMIIANPIDRDDVGFEAIENEVLVLSRGSTTQRLPKQHKQRLARTLIEIIANQYYAKNSAEDSRQSNR